MANEYLQRTPTSTGNRRVWTWSGWVKRNKLGVLQYIINRVYLSSSNFELYFTTSDTVEISDYTNGYNIRLITTQTFRDVSSWYHILLVIDTTSSIANDRVKLFVNGNRITSFGTQTTPSINLNTQWNNTQEHQFSDNGPYDNFAELTDIFFIDGQALTPDVFGFYKVGKGYISAGSTQSTDFRPGQWVPKTPRVIKTAINNNGGFGVNGFYLPMNDSNNFGADFHCEPNSIIKLQENLPQPRSRIDGVGDYTGALRDDPFKQYLIYAQPNVLGGLQNGYGDYSHIIRGSGSPKTITGGDAGASGTPVISTTQSLYYGSSLYFDGSNDTINVETNDSNYLGRDFTIEFWIWMDSQASQMAFNTTPHTSFGISLNRDGSGQTSLYIGNGSNWQTGDFRSGGVLYSQQWNHVAVERYNNAITIYHNGDGQGTTTAYMPTGFSSLFRYGTYNSISGEPVFGYIQDYRVYSGVAKYKGGFDVPRPYTPVGIATWRAVPDSPANNFATLNPIDKTTGGTLTNGNLTFADAGADGWDNSRATIGVSTGKYYWEMRADAVVYVVCASIAGPSGNDSTKGLRLGFLPGQTDDAGVTYYANGYLYHADNQGSGSPWGSGYTGGDIISIALDMSDSGGKVWFSKNGTWQVSGDPSTGTNAARSNLKTYANTWFPISGTYFSSSAQTYNFGQNPTFSGNTTAGTYTDSNNKGLFKYQPPSGFLALCEDNLPTPAISDPGKHFKTVLWTGDGNSGRSITGVGFTPDLVWMKGRNGTSDHSLIDSVRGKGVTSLSSNQTYADNDYGLKVLSFDSDGFSTGTGSINFSYANSSGANYVAWCWKAGAGTTSTNTNGSITSVVSVNQDAGFSIVSYTGNGSAGETVGHGLGITPAMVIIKSRNEVRSWIVFHRGASPTPNPLSSTTFALGSLSSGGLSLNLANGTFAYTMDGQTNVNGNTYIAYCWSEIEGFSKAFSYVGNGSTDGPLVYLNFKPAFVIIKQTNGTGDWYIFDSSRNSSNPVSLGLLSNTAQIDGDYTGWGDFLSNGFKIRRTDSAWNGSGSTYVGFAWAESPFQTANAK